MGGKLKTEWKYMDLTEHILKSQLISLNLIFGTQKSCFLFMAMYKQHIYDMNKWTTQESQKRFKGEGIIYCESIFLSVHTDPGISFQERCDVCSKILQKL